MLAWVVIEPDPPKNILYIIVMICLYGIFFVGVGLFLMNSILLGIVMFGGELSAPERTWVRRHMIKHMLFSLGWALAVLLSITASSDLRIGMIANTVAVAVLFMYGNFYRDLDRMPAEVRKIASTG
jgi:hypothetical protein